MICRDIAMLHPLVRNQFVKLNELLHKAYMKEVKVWFMPFETYRSPERQNALYRQGRTEPGKKVTNAQAWQSPHQFGLAADFVPCVPKHNGLNGPTKWDWDAASDSDWAFLASCAALVGLNCPIVWDRPHVEARDVWEDFRTIIKYREGRFDEIWPGLEKGAP